VSTASALRERAALLDELHQIVQAMKNLAFAELQRVGRVQPAQAQARDRVLQALSTLHSAAPQAPAGRTSTLPVVWLAIGSERGFCGAFNAHLVEELAGLRRADPQARLLIAGRRLHDLLGDLTDTTVLTGCASIDDADDALDDWMRALTEEIPRCRELWLLHADEAGLARLRLLPEPVLPSDAASNAGDRTTPLHYLPLPALRPALVHQVLRLLLQGGLCASLKHENHWRLSQMQRAQDHLDGLGRALERRYASSRQADITNELETLMSSAQGSSSFTADSPFAPTSH
jgi:F-type H+-transporting ATPase subunit gamma